MRDKKNNDCIIVAQHIDVIRFPSKNSHNKINIFLFVLVAIFISCFYCPAKARIYECR